MTGTCGRVSRCDSTGSRLHRAGLVFGSTKMSCRLDDADAQRYWSAGSLLPGRRGRRGCAQVGHVAWQQTTGQERFDGIVEGVCIGDLQAEYEACDACRQVGGDELVAYLQDVRT